MTQESNVPTNSLENRFVQSMSERQACSLHPTTSQEKACPSYYKYFLQAADWHVVTIILAISMIFLFIGVALQKK